MKKALLFSIGCQDRMRLFRKVLSQKYDCEIYISDFSHDSKKYIDRREKDLRYIHSLSYKKNISLKRIISYLLFAKKVLSIIKSEKPDLIYVMLPPNALSRVVSNYARGNNVRVIFDVYDLWPESFPIEKFKRVKFIFRKWENNRNKSFKEATDIFFECNLYKEKLAGVIPNNVNTATFYLTKKINDDELQYIKKGVEHYSRSSDDCIRLAYLGSINNIIDISEISTLINELVKDGLNVEIDIVGIGENKDKFKKSIMAAGASVKDYGAIYDTISKFNILGTCDFALNMMVNSVKVGLTTKSIDYTMMGLPLINSIRGDTSKFIDTSLGGVNIYEEGAAHKIEVIFKNEKDLIMLHKNVFDFFCQHFTENAFLNNCNNYFQFDNLNEIYKKDS